MQKFLAPTAAGLCLFMGAPVLADPGPGDGQTGLYYDGVAELEFSLSNDVVDRGDLGGRIDARVGLLGAGDGPVQFGFELGAEGHDFEGANNLIGIEAIGYMVTDFGTFSIGAPFSADAGFGPETLFDRTVITSLLLPQANISPQLFLQAEEQLVPGARYDGAIGPVDVALSFHEFTQDFDFTAVSGAASYQISFVTLTGTANYFFTDSDDVHTLGLAAESNFGPLGGVIEVQSVDGEDYVLTLEGSYDVSDSFSVAAGLTELDRSGPDTSWLVEAEYGFGNGTFISATAGRTLGNGEAAVGIGLEF